MATALPLGSPSELRARKTRRTLAPTRWALRLGLVMTLGLAALCALGSYGSDWHKDASGKVLLAIYTVLLLGCLPLLAWLMHEFRPERFGLLCAFVSRGFHEQMFGFWPTAAGQTVPTGFRPLLAEVPRTVVSYGAAGVPPVAEDLAALAADLRAGRSVLLAGEPLDGKTLALLRIVQQAPSLVVVQSRADRPLSAGSVLALSRLDVLLLVDDLHAFPVAAAALGLTLQRLRRRAGRVRVLASCLLPELNLQRRQDPAMAQFYGEFDKIAVLARPAPADVAPLAAALGEAAPQDFPTLGELCLRDASAVTRARFAAFDEERRDCFRAIRLLASNGVAVYRARLLMALRTAFDRELDEATLAGHIEALAACRFLLPEGADNPLVPEPAYVSGRFAGLLLDGRSLVRQHQRWLQAALAEGDMLAAWNAAMAAFERDDEVGALHTLAALMSALLANPQLSGQPSMLADCLYNIAVAHERLGERERAVAAYTAYRDAIESSEDPGLAAEQAIWVSRAMVRSAMLLHQLPGREAKVRAMCDATIARLADTQDPDLFGLLDWTVQTRAALLGQGGPNREQAAAFDLLIARFAEAPDPGLRRFAVRAVLMKSQVLRGMGCAPEAIAIVERVLARERAADAPINREQFATVLLELAWAHGDAGRHASALAACHELLASLDVAPGAGPAADGQRPGAPTVDDVSANDAALTTVAREIVAPALLVMLRALQAGGQDRQARTLLARLERLCAGHPDLAGWLDRGQQLLDDGDRDRAA